MALRFIDSFDHYSTSFLARKYTTVGGGAISGSGRFGSGYQATTTAYAERVIDAQSTWIIGFAFKPTALDTAGNNVPLLALLDSGTTQIELRTNAQKKLFVTRNGTSIGSVGTTVLSLGVWYYVELKVTINNSTGSFEVRLNGVTEASGSGLDTQNTANATADTIRIAWASAPGGGNQDVMYDDLYVCDGTGSAPNNDFLGDIRVESRSPNGNGNSSQLVGSDGNSTDNYLLVDESPPNDDTDYVESNTVGNEDTYAFQDLTPTTGTVYGVQVGLYARKDDAGSRSIKSVARLSATEVDSAARALSMTYQYHLDVREAKPGGGAWTISDVNSAEFGAKIA